MAPDARAGQATPTKKYAGILQSSPHRTTSQLSTISVSAGMGSEGLPTLSSHEVEVSRSRPSLPSSSSGSSDSLGSLPMVSSTTLSTHSASGSTSRNGRSIVMNEENGRQGDSSRPSPSRTRSGSSTPGLISRKGKEKERDNSATTDISGLDVAVFGELSMKEEGATRGLREFVRRSTVGEEVRPRREISGAGSSRSVRSARSRQERQEEGIGAQERVLDISDVGGEALVERTYSPRRYYVLTNAGKPVFT